MALIAVASALFMQAVDSTALSTALPTLARAFHTNPINLKLALTSYIMALAVFVPASGWAADRFGARRVFISAMMVFLVGSVACGLSHSLGQLVAARILQGAGGAMMTPVGRIIAVGSQPRDQLLKAMVWMTTPALFGPIVGPPLSGLLLSIADWPWIFYVNVPVGLLGMLAVLKFVPRREQPHPGRFDGLGFFLVATCISMMMVAAESAGVGFIPPWMQAAAWALAAVTGVAYVRHAKGMQKPVLNLALLRYRTLRVNLLGGGLARMTMGATPFLLPLLLQSGLGWSPLKAGMVTISGALGAMFARVGAQSLLRRFGYKRTLIATGLLGGVVGLAPGLFTASTPLVVIIAMLGLAGFMRANHLTSLATLAFADIPDAAVSQASGLTSVVQQMSQALGITVAGLVLHVSQQMSARHGLRPMDVHNFTLPFAAIGLITAAATLDYIGLHPSAGANLHGREGKGGRR
jgi:EmrB/QacA subfamily drug resistance transporter